MWDWIGQFAERNVFGVTHSLDTAVLRMTAIFRCRDSWSMEQIFWLHAKHRMDRGETKGNFSKNMGSRLSVCFSVRTLWAFCSSVKFTKRSFSKFFRSCLGKLSTFLLQYFRWVEMLSVGLMRVVAGVCSEDKAVYWFVDGSVSICKSKTELGMLCISYGAGSRSIYSAVHVFSVLSLLWFSQAW